MPTRLYANWLYLISLALIVTAGSVLQNWSIAWGLLLTELFLILLPALMAVRRSKLNGRAVLKLRWPGARWMWLGLVIGSGLWPVSLALDSLSALMFGYTPPSPFGALPTDPLSIAALFAAMALAAPLCEEIFFRGYLLSAYESKGARLSLWAVALLFAFFHLRLQGLLALLPLALALTFLAQKSGSLWPGVAAHFAVNALSVGLMLNPQWLAGKALVVGGLAVAGGLLALAGLAWAGRASTPAPVAGTPESGGRWLPNAPLFMSGLLYIAFASLELLSGRFPELRVARQLQLTAPWTHPLNLDYELRNILDEPVGAAECHLTPTPDGMVFGCAIHQQAFTAQTASSYFQTDSYEGIVAARWALDDLRLLEGSAIRRGASVGQTQTVAPVGADLILSVAEGRAAPQTLALPPEALWEPEWAWRLSALPFAEGYAGSRVQMAWPARWVETAGRSEPQLEETIALVHGPEQVSTPAGEFTAWKVTLGAQAAWYAVNAPHALVQYDNDFVTYVLIEMTGGKGISMTGPMPLP